MHPLIEGVIQGCKLPFTGDPIDWLEEHFKIPFSARSQDFERDQAPHLNDIIRTAVDLPPLLGADAAQANAVNAAGHAVGYSVTAGVPTATLWIHGVGSSLWPGVASAINDHDVSVGYVYGAGLTTIAYQSSFGQIPLVSGYDSSLAMGINNSGTVVGIAYNSLDTTQQTAFVWSETNGMQVVPGCQAALAINDGGTIAGIAADFNASVCGGQEFSVGAVTHLNKTGQAVGYSNDHGFVFPATDLGASSSATGINDYGWVIGESFTPLAGAGVRSHLARLFNPRLSGVSHPFIWSQDSGLVPLQGIVTANGINADGVIVGATVQDGQVRGVLLQP